MSEMSFDYQSFVPVLESLRVLLLKHMFLAQEQVVSELIDLAHLESPDFQRRLQFGGVWGGAGSVADVCFSGNVEGPEDELEEDDRRYQEALVHLGERMLAEGLKDDSVEKLLRGLREYLTEG